MMVIKTQQVKKVKRKKIIIIYDPPVEKLIILKKPAWLIKKQNKNKEEKRVVVFKNPEPTNKAPPNKMFPHMGNDNFNTPREAWDLIDKILKIDDKKVWCPFYNDGKITCHFKNIIHAERDFFNYEPDDYECVVDNPPYSFKKDVIKKLIDNGKPFALLLPLNTMIRRYFQKSKRDDLTIIIPKSIYKFVGEKKTIRVDTAWFCWGFKLKKQMIWEDDE